MRSSVFLYTITILAGPIHFAFGASILAGFGAATSVLKKDIANTNANFKAIKANGDLETSTLVQDYQTVQKDAQNVVNSVAGDGAVSAADQQTVVADISDVASDFADLLETTGDDAGDFEIDPDQSNIQTAANNAESVILDVFDSAIRLAPKHANEIESMKTDVEEADSDLNNDDANSPLRRRKASRVFRA